MAGRFSLTITCDSADDVRQIAVLAEFLLRDRDSEEDLPMYLPDVLGHLLYHLEADGHDRPAWALWGWDLEDWNCVEQGCRHIADGIREALNAEAFRRHQREVKGSGG